MNSQRLLALSISLADELQTASLLDLINTLSSQLTDAINSPSEGTQRAVQSTRDTLEMELRKAPSNSMSPGLRADLETFKVNDRTPVSELVGNGLLARMSEALDDGGYTSVTSLDQIQRLVEDMNALHAALQQLNSGTQALGFRKDDLEPGESVVGFAIPRDAVAENLDNLQREMKFFGRLVSAVTEVVTGASGDVAKVRSLQSSDFVIELATSLSVAAGVASAVEYIVRGLKKFKEIRTVKDKMQEFGFQQELLDAVDKKGEEAMDIEVENISAEIFQNCSIDDQGRVNELKTSIRLGLKGLAARLERGYSVEVRTELPSQPTKDDKQKDAAVSAFSQVRFERTTPLLALPDGEEEHAPAGRHPVKKTRRKSVPGK